MVTDTHEEATVEQTERDLAIAQLKKRRDFHAHLLIYVLVNGFLAVIWAMTTAPGFFWPVFPIAGWGIGVVMNAWDVYWRQPITEEEIRRQIDREHHQV